MIEVELLDSLFDSRQRIKTTQVYPWVIHGLLSASFSTSVGSFSARGTGTLISGNCVLTAAHCLFDYEHRAYARDITFSLGVFHRKPLKIVKGKVFYAHPEYLYHQNEGYDFAIVELEEAVGNTFGAASLVSYNTDELRKMRVNVTGYPGRKKFLEILLNRPSYDLYTMEGPIQAVTDEKMFYAIDTSGGQSGAGVWKWEQDIIQCIGVHTTGSKVEGNGAIRLNEKNAQTISEWLERLKEKNNGNIAA